MKKSLNRRNFLKTSAAGVTALAMPAISTAASKTIRIGYITATSGPRAAFGAADGWLLKYISKQLEGGINIDGTKHDVEIIFRDNQSNPNRSASVGNELILREGVDLLLMGDGDAAISVGEMADLNEIPNMSTMTPWQAWLGARGSNAETGFPWSFGFFFGIDDAVSTYVRIWDQLETNKKVGDFYLDNPAGVALSHPEYGLPGYMSRGGYKQVPGGLYKRETEDYSAQITTFKEAECDIVASFGDPANWHTFWNQCAQLGYTPEAATCAAAFLFPASIEAMGERGDGMTMEVWWTPLMPFSSSFNGISAKEFADAYQEETGKQWIQTLGYTHALFETGIAALKQGGKDRVALRDAMAGLKMDTMVGPINFKDSPIKSVAKTELAGGQWRKSSGRFPYEMVITENTLAPSVPVQSNTVALSKL